VISRVALSNAVEAACESLLIEGDQVVLAVEFAILLTENDRPAGENLSLTEYRIYEILKKSKKPVRIEFLCDAFDVSLWTLRGLISKIRKKKNLTTKTLINIRDFAYELREST
jgi:hypothetical protein